MGLTKNQAFPSKWLKADDVPTTGIDVTIEGVTQDEVDYGNGSEIATNIRFREFDKPLGLNITNWDSIEALYGPDTDGWTGHKIRLYRTTTRNRAGAVVPCVRIQPPLGQPAPTAPASDRDKLAAIVAEHNPSEADYKKAIGHTTMAEFKKAGGTAAEAVEKLTAFYASPNGGELDDLPF